MVTLNRAALPLQIMQGPINAAGYGRKDVAQMLLDKGADIQARNQQGQLPIDAATVNREMHMVSFLDRKAGKSKPAQGSKAGKNITRQESARCG